MTKIRRRRGGATKRNQMRSGIRVLHSSAGCVVASKPVNAFSMNQYIIGCRRTSTAFLLDCGDDDIGTWVAYAKDQLLKDKAGAGGSATIRGILQTHCHVDHIGGLQPTIQALSKASDDGTTSVYYHKGEQVWLDNPFAIGMGPLESAFPSLRGPVDLSSCGKPLNDGDVVNVGDLKFKALHVPGHTPGHLVFYCAEEEIAFTGDLIFQGSVGRTDFPNCDPAAMRESLRKAGEAIDGKAVLFSGHGDPTTMGEEKASNPYLSRM